MLKFLFRHAASPARARMILHAAPVALASVLALPAAHGAEAAPDPAMPSLPFGQYQSWRDEPVGDWRAANDRVGEIGGWMTYLREAQDGEGGGQGMHDHHHHHGH